MPSPYVKKGYGEVSKEAEDRIRNEIIVKCKVCKRLMEFIRDDIEGNRYFCDYCLREVTFDDRITQL
jgi:acetyl-CoA carboxylase beta subunit